MLQEILKFKLTKEQRIFYLISGVYLWSGLLLSDGQPHWMLYIPATFFIGAFFTKYCVLLSIIQYLNAKLN